MSIASTVLLLILLGWWISSIIRARLRHVPGPWLSKITNLHLIYYDFTYRRNEKILRWHQQYGPVICIAPNEVSVATMESTKEIYGATHQWSKSDYFDNFKGYGMRSVFAAKPHSEHRAKRKLTSAFYQATTIYKLPEIEERIQERCQAVMRQIQHGIEVDVYGLTDWYAFDNITFLVLGPDQCTSCVEHVCQERQILQDLKHQQFHGPLRVRCPTIYRNFSRLVGNLRPSLGYLLADDKLALWCQQRVSSAVNDPRLSNSQSLIRHMSELHKNRESMEPLDHSYIAAEILDNINAAEATVAVTATYLIWRLTEHPYWQWKIREELSALPRQPDDTVAFADIDNQVPSLEACLREVYRLHPASSGRAERIVPSGGHTLSAVHLPEDTIVTTSILSLHKDENLFPNPEGFVPERWLEMDEDSFKKCDAQLIAFGYGGRICLGKALATMEIKVLMAQLYLEYETFPTTSLTAESMRQCSTHDAVPYALKCMVQFRRAPKHF